MINQLGLDIDILLIHKTKGIFYCAYAFFMDRKTEVWWKFPFDCELIMTIEGIMIDLHLFSAFRPLPHFHLAFCFNNLALVCKHC